jgi:large subunit ribosomal protein L29
MKASEFRELMPDEKTARLDDLKEEQRGLRFGHVMQQVSNPLEIRAIRRDIARLKTIIAEEARKAERGPADGSTVKAGGEEV